METHKDQVGKSEPEHIYFATLFPRLYSNVPYALDLFHTSIHLLFIYILVPLCSSANLRAYFIRSNFR